MKKLVVLLVALTFTAVAMAQDPFSMVQKALTDQNFDADELAVFYDAAWSLSDVDFEESRAVTFSSSKAYSRTLDIEVACVGPSVAYGGSDPDTLGSNGQDFIILGYIYTAGTLANGTGVNPTDGSPEFPENLLGTWICSGHIYSGAAFTDLRFLMSGEMIQVGGLEPGANPSVRPVEGGTGTWQLARGQVTQTITGSNQSGAPNFSFHFEFRPNIDFKR